MSDIVWMIVLGGLATYIIRWSGYAVLARFERLHPRVISGLNAVPAAVLTAIIVPAAVDGGFAEISALIATALITMLGGGGTLAFAGGSAILLLLRTFVT